MAIVCRNSISQLFQIELRGCRSNKLLAKRRLPAGRHLIGSGRNCAIRLNDAAIPPIHSQISVAENELYLEAIEPRPHVLLAGKVTNEALLQDGDRLTIGDHEFQFSQVNCKSETADNDRTVSELVDLLEQEFLLIDHLEAGRREGADALLDAVLEHANSMLDKIATEQSSLG